MGVTWEVSLVGEEFSYLFISFSSALRTQVLAVTWASGSWDPSWLQDGPAMENSSAFYASGSALARAGGRPLGVGTARAWVRVVGWLPARCAP